MIANLLAPLFCTEDGGEIVGHPGDDRQHGDDGDSPLHPREVVQPGAEHDAGQHHAVLATPAASLPATLTTISSTTATQPSIAASIESPPKIRLPWAV